MPGLSLSAVLVVFKSQGFGSLAGVIISLGLSLFGAIRLWLLTPYGFVGFLDIGRRIIFGSDSQVFNI